MSIADKMRQKYGLTGYENKKMSKTQSGAHTAYDDWYDNNVDILYNQVYTKDKPKSYASDVVKNGYKFYSDIGPNPVGGTKQPAASFDTLPGNQLEDLLIEQKKYDKNYKKATKDLAKNWTPPKLTSTRDERDERVRNRYLENKRLRELDDILAGNSHINQPKGVDDVEGLANSLIENKKYGAPVQYTEPIDLKRARAIEYTNAGNERYELQQKIAKEDAQIEGRRRAGQLEQYYTLLNNPDFRAQSGYTPTGGKADNPIAKIRGYQDYAFNFILYDAINGNPDAIEALTYQNSPAYQPEWVDYRPAETQEISETERRIFNYLFLKQGKDSALAYYKLLQPELEKRAAQTEAAKIQQEAREAPVGAAIASVLTAPARALEYPLQAIEYAATGKVNENSPNYSATRLRDNVNEALTENWGRWGKWGYQTGMSMLDFLVNLGMGAAIGGAGTKLSEAATLILMGNEAAADTAVQKKQAGYDDERAFVLGTIAGLAEIATEKIGFDALFNTDLLKQGKKGFVKYLLRNTAAEGAEEGMADLINWAADGLYDALASQSESEWKRNIAALKAEHPDWDDKQLAYHALAQRAEEIGFDVLGGAVSGLAMAGGGAVLSSYNTARNMGKDLRGAGNDVVQAAIAEGLESDPNTKSHKVAEKLNEKLQQGKQLTDREIGQLYQANTEAIDAENAEFKEASMQAARERMEEKYKGLQLPTVQNENTQNTQNANEAAETAQNVSEGATLATQNTTAQTNTETQSIAEIGKLQLPTVKENNNVGQIAEGIENDLRNGSERVNSTNPGEQVRAVEESAGRNPRRQTLGLARDGESPNLTYERKAVSTKELTGSGSDSATIYRVTDGETQYTKKASEMAKAANMKAVFFGGDNLHMDGVSARGMIDGDTIYIRVDHPQFTADQLMGHELGHKLIREGKVDVGAIRDKIAELVGQRSSNWFLGEYRQRYDGIKDSTQRMAQAYADAYEGSGMTDAEIWEEIVCDALGGMNAFAGDRTMTDSTRGIVDQYLAEIKNQAETQQTRAPPAESKTESKSESAKFSSEFGKDSDGRTLTEAQQEYFKDSKARDAEGRLLTLYHGTTAYGDITIFKKGRSGWLGAGIYLTSDKNVAQRYADAMGYDNGKVYELYANVTNPLVVKASNPVPEILRAAYNSDSVYTRRSAKQANDPSIITPADIKKLQSKGYDGIIWEYGRTYEVSVFSAEQVKDATNKTPSSSPNIHYSREFTPTAEDTTYLNAVNSGDMETVQRLVDEAAREAGYTVEAYHGTPETFTVFHEYGGREIGYHVGTKSAAEQRVQYQLNKNIMRLYTNLGKTIQMPDIFGLWYGIYDYVCYVLGEEDSMVDRDFMLEEKKATSKYRNKSVFVKNEAFYQMREAVEKAAKEHKPSTFDRAVQMQRKYILSLGIDTISYKNQYESVGSKSYMLMHANQVKSADPVTYDDSGNVIPLSERFNPENNDIRYSREFGESPVSQKISSAKTSIKQIPALFKDKNVTFGKTNIDIGGGKFDLATDYLKSLGTRNLVFDPYNRSEEVNAATLKYLQDGNKADTATCANVLNVIKEAAARENVILETAKAIKDDGKAYFMVYEGDGSGQGRETSSGWQNNRKTADYVDEISKYFDNVERHGKLITASEPRANLPKAAWETTPGKATMFSREFDAAPVYNKTVLLNESTVDKYLADYAAKSSPKYAQAYIAYMSPKNFLDLTTSITGRNAISAQTEALDTEKLADATRHQPFQLQIDHSNGEVIGHEGRHRAMALMREGIRRIPVLLFDSSNKYSKTALDSLDLTGQDFGHSRSYAIVTVHDLQPLSYENRDNVIKTFATQPTIERIAEGYGRTTIRYSREFDADLFDVNEDIRKRIADIQDELARTKRHEMYWKGQTRRTTNKTVREADINKLAKRLIKNYSSTLEAADIAGDLQALGNYIVNNGDAKNELTYEDLRDRADAISKKIVKNALAESEGNDAGSYRELRSYLRDQTLRLPAENKADLIDYAAFKKANPALKVSTKSGLEVDAAYMELQSKLGKAFFPDDITNPAGQLMRIADVVSELKPIFENPYDYQQAEAMEYISSDILDSLLSEEVRQTPPTFADRKAAEIERVRGNYKQKIAALQEQAQQRVDNLRVRKNEQIEALKEYYAEQKQEARERRADADARTKLLKIARRLNNKKLPLVMKAQLAQYIGELDLVAKSMTGKTLDKLTALKDWYETQKEELGEDFIKDEAIEKKLDRLSKKRINDLTASEVADLTQVLQFFEASIIEANKFKNSKIKEDRYAAGMRVVWDVQNARPGKINWQLRPSSAAMRMVGYDDTSPLATAMDEMIEGERQYDLYQREAVKPYEKWINDKRFMKSFSGKDARMLTISGTDVNGNAVTQQLTPAMLVEMYLASRNEDNMRHYQRGYAVFPNMELYRKGDIDEAYNKTNKVSIKRSAILEAAKQLTQDELAFASAITNYYNNFAPKRLNETSLIIDGYEKFNEENYYPIVSDPNFLTQDYEALGDVSKDGKLTSLANPGFAQERTHAANPAIVRDANLTLMQQIRKNGQYVTKTIPLQNMSKLLNVKGRGMTTSVREALTNQYSSSADAYLKKFMRDYAGQNAAKERGLDPILKKIRSSYAGGVLTLGAGTAIKQAASYPTAAAVLQHRALLKAMNPAMKADVSFIDELTAAFTKRTQGFSSMELGDLASINKSLPQALNWIQAIDVGTTKLLKRAAYFDVRSERPNLKVGSNEFKKAVVEKYIEAIEKTQPNYSVALRPEVLRSNSEIVRTISMFMTQPLQNYNLLYDAFGNYNAKRAAWKNTRSAEAKAALNVAKRQVVRTVTSQLIASFVFALMQAGWDFLRGKDKKYRDKDGNLNVGSFLKGMGLNMLSNGAGMFVGGKAALELAEAAADGILKAAGKNSIFDQSFYGLESAELGAITDAGKAALNVASLITSVVKASANGEDVDWAASARKLLAGAEDISVMFGVPLGNLTKDMQALARLVFAGVGKATGDKVKADYYAMRIVNTAPADYYNQLYRYYKTDREKFNELYNLMVNDKTFDKLFTPDKIKDAMEDKMKKDQGVDNVKDIDKRFLSPEEDITYDAIMTSAEKSPLWKGSRAAVQQKIKTFAYDAAEGKETKADDMGISYEQYVTILLNLDKYDTPNKSGEYGGDPTNDEVTAALNHTTGYTRQELYNLWQELTGSDSDKNNPYRAQGSTVKKIKTEAKEQEKAEEKERGVTEIDTSYSSMFSGASYDPSTHALKLKFRGSGKTYTYNVPESVWEDMQKADSLGNFYNSRIKGKYTAA